MMIDELKGLLTQFNLDDSEENFNKIIEFLPEFLEKNETIYVAGSIENQQMSFKQLENNGKSYFLAFTSPLETKDNVLGFESRNVFTSFADDESVEGVIINPYTDCFVMKKTLLSLLLDLTLYRTTSPMDMN